MKTKIVTLRGEQLFTIISAFDLYLMYQAVKSGWAGVKLKVVTAEGHPVTPLDMRLVDSEATFTEAILDAHRVTSIPPPPPVPRVLKPTG